MIPRSSTRRIRSNRNFAPSRANPVTARLDRWFKRNAIGEQKESEGKFDDAIRLYEANVEENADTIFSYERLSILYKRKQDEANEIRVIRKAIKKLREKAERKPLDNFQENQLRVFHRRLVELTGEDPNSIRPLRQRMPRML